MTDKIDLEKIDEEIKNIFDEMEPTSTEEKYNLAAKTILITNYVLFLGIIWKSLEIDTAIPFSIKISVFLFGFGILFSSLRYAADYLSEGITNIASYKKLMLIYEKYGEEIKNNDINMYIALKLNSKSMSWALNHHENKNIPEIIFVLFYLFTGFISFLISFCFLFFGLFFLAIGTM